MRRLFWFTMGITIGVMVVRRLQTLAQRLTPSGIAGGLSAGLSDLAGAIGDFTADVRAAMSERETQLRESTGLDGRLGRQPDQP